MTPEQRQRKNELDRAYRKRNAERLAAKRREKWALLTPEQMAAKNAYRRALYQRLKLDPQWKERVKKRRIINIGRDLLAGGKAKAKRAVASKEKRLTMTEEQYQVILERNRRYRLHKYHTDPAWRARDLERKREYHRRKRAEASTRSGQAAQDNRGNKTSSRVDGRSKARKATGPSDTGGAAANAA